MVGHFSRMLAAGLVLALATLAASAQTNEKAKPDEPATAPVAGPNSGTAPGGAGSTGWSGGTGGSNIGTSPHAPSPGSPTEQPPTATGLDPIKGEQRKN